MGNTYCCDKDDQSLITEDVNAIWRPGVTGRRRSGMVHVSTVGVSDDGEVVPPPEPTADQMWAPEQRLRLKVLVQNFASSAIQGKPCYLLDLSTGANEVGTYSLDSNLRTLTLTKTGSLTSVSASGSTESTAATTSSSSPSTGKSEKHWQKAINLTDLQEVVQASDLSGTYRTPALKALEEAIWPRLVILKYQESGTAAGDMGAPPCFLGLIMENPQACETFATCLHILRFYAEVVKKR
mmetsp:Transcript_18572/g.39758  ORF Transcript_18572/g.39758 Transcript_18572/m.39758 type:complete len:239 (+) Transcript_18572:540-1256(+)